RAPGPHDFAVREPPPPMIFSGPRTQPSKVDDDGLVTPVTRAPLVPPEQGPSLSLTAFATPDLRARRTRVHRIPSRVRGDRERPSHRTEQIGHKLRKLICEVCVFAPTAKRKAS